MEMKRKRFLSLVLALMMVICLMPAPTANAATISGGQVLYLVPNTNWTSSSAWFAAYFFNSSANAWAKATYHVNGKYVVEAPAGSWTNVIFCRMNPSGSTCSWDYVWNQTNDLTYANSKNCYTVASGAWSNGSGTWSQYQEIYTVAGTAGLCGVDWTPSHTANDMTLSNGVYTKTFEAVEAGDHAFKVVADHAWTSSWPSSNYEFTLDEKSNVTISFNPVNGTVSVETTPWVCPHANTSESTENATCGEDGATKVICSDCSETISTTVLPATGNHSYTNGTCTVCDHVRNMEAQIDETEYETLTAALAAAEENDTIKLLKPVTIDSLMLMNSIDLDLNGCILTVSHMTAYPGSAIIDSAGSGLLKVNKDKLMLQSDNGYLPIWSEEDAGYVLRTCKNLHYAGKTTGTNRIYQFLPAIGTDSYKLLDAGAEISGVTMKVEVSWVKENGLTGSTTFTYSDELIQAFYDSYDPNNNVFTQAFVLKLIGIGDKDISYKVYFESETGVLLTCAPANAE